MGKTIRRLLILTVLAAVVGLSVWALQPKPHSVDIATIATGPLEVTVEEEGVTRIRDVYTVSAAVGGKVLRSPRKVGDEVVANETVLAIVEPTDPTFLDARSQRVAEAAVSAARAAVVLAEAQVRQNQSSLDFARSDLERAVELARRKTISERALEKAGLDVATAEASLASAEATLDVRKRELESAKAQLIQPGEDEARPENCCVQVRAPVNGRVLKVVNESEQVVPAGTPLIEVGDPANLELVVDLLSRDAVRVVPGARARIDAWGGARTLDATVERIEPAAFTKVSALGIEEQRVKTILRLDSPPDVWRELGHGFRIVAHIVVWQKADAVIVPLAALFRRGDDWATFRVENGVAHLVKVSIGERNQREAEVVDGLSAGDRVILHPNDEITDGAEIAERIVAAP
ncbi:MAG: efflux RND transporter periplasmic adaptor subunit [Hyphomicrobiales bacterium]